MAIRTPLLMAIAAIASSFITYSLTHESTGSEEARATVVSGSTSDISDVRSSPQVRSNSQEGCVPKSSGASSIVDFQNEDKSPDAKDEEDESLANANDIDKAIANRVKRREEVKADILSFIYSERKKGTKNISTAVENKFYQEEVDEEWANDKESYLSNRFESDEELKDVHPLEITCRSENCKIVLSIESQENISSISHRLSNAPIDSDREGAMVYAFPDSSTNRLVVYVSKKSGMDMIR